VTAASAQAPLSVPDPDVVPPVPDVEPLEADPPDVEPPAVPPPVVPDAVESSSALPPAPERWPSE
jgi:hypothetical protein